jgi:hypothetical protein
VSTKEEERVAMLTLIPGLPANVVGVEAHDKVTAEDYNAVLVPAVDAAQQASADGKVRLLYVLGHEVPDFTAGAMWEDTKLGVGQFRAWERIAIVTDADWLRHAVHALGWVMPGDVKVFGADGLNDAAAWLLSAETD